MRQNISSFFCRPLLTIQIKIEAVGYKLNDESHFPIAMQTIAMTFLCKFIYYYCSTQSRASQSTCNTHHPLRRWIKEA